MRTNEPDITFDFNPIANPGKSEFGALWHGIIFYISKFTLYYSEGSRIGGISLALKFHPELSTDL